MKKLSLKEAFDSQKGFEEIINFSNNIAQKMNQEHQQQMQNQQQTGDGRNFDYGQVKSDSREGQMAKETLKSIVRNAQQLDNFLRNEDDLPEWCQTYLAVCEDRLQTTLNYLQSRQHQK